MPPKTVSQLIDTSKATWQPSKLKGIEYIPLQTDAQERIGTLLFRLAPGTTYPRHRHPGGEEMLLLRGDMVVGDRVLKSGDFLYSSPGSIHTIVTVGGCMFLSILPKPLEIIPTASNEDLAENVDPNLAVPVEEKTAEEVDVTPDLER